MMAASEITAEVSITLVVEASDLADLQAVVSDPAVEAVASEEVDNKLITI